MPELPAQIPFRCIATTYLRTATKKIKQVTTGKTNAIQRLAISYKGYCGNLCCNFSDINCYLTANFMLYE